MGPSDVEIEARLAALLRRRAAIDREIADHLLYRDLARRLGGAGDAGADARPSAAPGDGPPGDLGREAPEEGRPAAGGPGALDPSPREAAHRDVPPRGPAAGLPPAIAFADDPTAARRYGRALVAAACAAIRDAGRPLHAGEILPHLADLGFTLPGRDPVAALNTRLWKRAAPGGPLRRLGDATYALAGAEGEAGGED